jgi:uncharacterized protein (TIGR03435 family)
MSITGARGPCASVLCLVVLAIGSVAAQTATEPQDAASFAVASIKVNTSDLPYDQSTDVSNGVNFVNERLRDLILFAYDVHEFQLSGGPGWIADARFDINARADGPLSPDEKRLRVRRLLADRFALRVRRDVREGAIYALVTTRGAAGPGLRVRDCAAPGIAGLPCNGGLASADGGVMRMGGISMTRLSEFLARIVGRVVTDETGLTGPYDVDLRWRPDIGMSPDLSDEGRKMIEARPALPAALREQLGLELQSRRGPVTLIVVESIARPTPD